jgi:Tol biopolymer transport system component
VLPHDKVLDPERKHRFVREAKAASALNHPHIITVHDIRSDSGVDFIVMEYVSGRTLDTLIPAQGLGIARSLRYAVQIADALATAHQAGIVHRDLKPSNVIVTDDDRIKVLDFGVAKLLEPPDRSGEDPTRTALATEAGTVFGTTAYMSPEQAEGRKVDARSDIFSFGAVLYELVTGQRAFAGNSRLSVLTKILHEDPALPSTLTPSITGEVEQIILRCLRKDPGRRYQTMADLKVSIEDIAADSAARVSTSARAVQPSSRLWRWAAVALLPVAVTAAYFASQSLRVARSSTAPLRAVPLAVLPGVVRYPSFSPDGNHVAFTWNGPNQDNSDVYVQQIGAGAPLRLTTDRATDYSPVWSPDGRAIAFLREQSDSRRHELRLVPPLGGPERKLTDIEPRGFLRPVLLAWCPDSRCIVVTDSMSPDGNGPDGLFIVSIESGEKRQLTSPGERGFADTDPAVSPDGRWLVFRRDVAPFSGQLQLVPLGPDLTAQGEPRSLTPTLLGASGPQWISNSEFLFSAKGSLWRMSTAAGSMPERLPFVGDDGIQPAISRPEQKRRGRLAYVHSYTDTNIWRIETSTPGSAVSVSPAVAISSTRAEEQPQLSPDARKITFMSARSGEWEVWVADASGANAVQLTSLAASPGFPRWSPDGKTIAFHSNSEEQFGGDVFVVPAEGGKPRNLTSHPATDVFPSFSHDGRWIYFSSTRTGAPFIWKIPVSGGNAVQVSPKNGFLAIESSDGAFLYYVESTTTDGTGPLWRLPLKGGDATQMAKDVAALAFALVDDGVYYIERVSGETRLRYVDFSTSKASTVAEKLGNGGLVGFGSLTASHDGRTILYSRVDSSVDDLLVVDNFH